MQRRGFPVTREMLTETVRQFLDSSARPNNFKDNRPGKYVLRSSMRFDNLTIFPVNRAHVDAIISQKASPDHTSHT